MTANRNDFIILNKKLDRYAKIIEDNFAVKLSCSDEDRRRLAFYMFVLEQVCETTDFTRLSECVVDTQFNRSIFKKSVDDYGIDVIYVNEDTFELKLFNFKYRDNFNPNKKQSLNDNFTSTKFLNLAINGNKDDFKSLSKKMKSLVARVNEILTSPKEEWKVDLYQVSNEAIEEKETNDNLRLLSEQYAIGIIPLALPTISEYMSIRPEPISAQIILESQALMSYSESEKTSAKSFIARMKCSELLRITSNSSDLRNKMNLEDSSELSNAYLDFGVLFDNVRGLVRKSKYNENIAKTLKENSKKFFMYNNGVTLIAKAINSTELPGKKALKLNIENFQVVNGGQTLRTIHEFNRNDSSNLEEYLYDSEVLVRMFMPDGDTNEAHKIAEFTNSQNTIKPVDLKSLASEQIVIEKFLDEHNIAYARKSGDTGPDDKKDYKHTISMETFGKILKANSGNPDQATNGLRDIFDSGYQKLFVEDFDIHKAPGLIEKYYRIINIYKKSSYRGNQLKYFYAHYYSGEKFKFTEKFIVDQLELSIEKYLKNNEATAVKALGSASFRKEFEADIDLNG